MSRNFIKEESIKRLKALIEKTTDVDTMKNTAGFKSLYNHYLNKYEKENLDVIIDLIQNGYNPENIILIVKERQKMSKSKKNDSNETKANTKKQKVNESKLKDLDTDYEEATEAFFKEYAHKDTIKISTIDAELVDAKKETEKFFSVSGQKVIEVPHVQVIIGDETNTEPEKKAEPKAEAKAEPKAEAKTEPVKAEAKTEPVKAEAKTEPESFCTASGEVITFNDNVSDTESETAQVDNKKKISKLSTIWTLIKTPIYFKY